MHSRKKNSSFNKNRVLLKFFMAGQGEIKKSYSKTCLSKNDDIKKNF